MVKLFCHSSLPITEDERTQLSAAAEMHEFWNLLCCEQKTSLVEIFGPALGPLGRMRYGTPDGQGDASLGLLRPAQPPQLYVTEGHRKRQVRVKLTDGRLHADAGVTDLRLCAADHGKPEEPSVTTSSSPSAATSDTGPGG